MYFIKDDIRFVQLFFNYIDSISNKFEMKDGTLYVKLKIGFWLKTLLDLNYNRINFFNKVGNSNSYSRINKRDTFKKIFKRNILIK